MPEGILRSSAVFPGIAEEIAQRLQPVHLVKDMLKDANERYKEDHPGDAPKLPADKQGHQRNHRVDTYPRAHNIGRNKIPLQKLNHRSEEHTSELQSRFDLVC